MARNHDDFDLDVRLLSADDSLGGSVGGGMGGGGGEEQDAIPLTNTPQCRGEGAQGGEQADMMGATDITCMTCNVNCDTYSGCGGSGPDTESGRTCGSLCATGDVRCA